MVKKKEENLTDVTVEGEVKEATPVKEKTLQEIEKESKRQKAQMDAYRKAQRKAAEEQLQAYKKRLMQSVEMKRLQVEEIQLNIEMFKAEKEYDAMEPEMKAYAKAKEEKEAKEQAKRQREAEEAKSKIEVVQGIPEELKEKK